VRPDPVSGLETAFWPSGTGNFELKSAFWVRKAYLASPKGRFGYGFRSSLKKYQKDSLKIIKNSNLYKAVRLNEPLELPFLMTFYFPSLEAIDCCLDICDGVMELHIDAKPLCPQEDFL